MSYMQAIGNGISGVMNLQGDWQGDTITGDALDAYAAWAKSGRDALWYGYDKANQYYNPYDQLGKRTLPEYEAYINSQVKGGGTPEITRANYDDYASRLPSYDAIMNRPVTEDPYYQTMLAEALKSAGMLGAKAGSYMSGNFSADLAKRILPSALNGVMSRRQNEYTAKNNEAQDYYSKAIMDLYNSKLQKQNINTGMMDNLMSLGQWGTGNMASNAQMLGANLNNNYLGQAAALMKGGFEQADARRRIYENAAKWNEKVFNSFGSTGGMGGGMGGGMIGGMGG